MADFRSNLVHRLKQNKDKDFILFYQKLGIENMKMNILDEEEQTGMPF